MENGNKPAFSIAKGSGMPKEWLEQNMFGLTKRETFAMAAMQGLLAKEGWAERTLKEGEGNSLKEILVSASIKYADELLKQLETK